MLETAGNVFGALWSRADILSSILIAVVTTAAFIVTLIEYLRRKALGIEENRPYVIVELERSHINLFDINIRNIGKSAAKDIYVKFSPNQMLITKVKINDLKLLKGMKFLPPDKMQSFLFGSYMNREGEKSIRKEFRVKVCYTDISGRKYEDNFILDPREYEGLVSATVKGVNEVAKTLEEIRKDLHKNAEANKSLYEVIKNQGLKIRNLHQVTTDDRAALRQVANLIENCNSHEFQLQPFVYDAWLLFKQARDILFEKNNLQATERKIVEELNWLIEEEWWYRKDEEVNDHFKLLVKLIGQKLDK